MLLQGEAKKAKAAQAEAAKKEIAELMAKAKADMDKADKKGEAEAAQSQADEIQKEVPISSGYPYMPLSILPRYLNHAP